MFSSVHLLSGLGRISCTCVGFERGQCVDEFDERYGEVVLGVALMDVVGHVA